MKSIFIAGLLAVSPAFAQTSGGTGTDMSAPAKGSNTRGAASGENSADSNLSSHQGPDAQGAPAPGTVKAATGDAGSAKRNKKHGGDKGKTVDSAQSGSKSPSQPSDSKEQ